MTIIQTLLQEGFSSKWLAEPYGYIELFGFAPWFNTGTNFNVDIIVEEGLQLR